MQLCFLLRSLEDASIRELNARNQAVFFVAACLIHLVWPSRLRIHRGCAEEFRNRVDRHLAGDFSRCMPSHAISYQVEVFGLHHGIAIFVVRSLATYVGLASRHHARLSGPLRYSPKFDSGRFPISHGGPRLFCLDSVFLS